MNAIVPERRSIIDRAKFLSQLRKRVEDANPSDLRPAVLDLLKIAYKKGRDEVWRRFEKDADGTGAAHAYCYLMDQVIRCLYDFTTTYVYPVTNPTRSERMSLVAVGGYGRGELAPYSDVDILFLLPYKQTPWGEQVVEYMLYMLWDLGLKVGHSTRSIDDCVRLAQGDLTIRTALLEKRFIWGDKESVRGARPALRQGRDRRHGTGLRRGQARRAGCAPQESRRLHAMSSSRTSRKARAACAISIRSTGSANISIG